MSECIICREEQTDFSDEHVIPDSLGGYYHIYTVCKQCNSKLGEHVDDKLVNHKFADFQRFIHGIKGKSGKVPNPFDGTHVLKENRDQKVQIRIDSNGATVPYLLPNVKYTGNGEIVDGFEIVIDKKDENNLNKMVEKIAKRIGVPFDHIDTSTLKHLEDRPEITSTLQIDTRNFKIGLLKIAYEFAVDTLPTYYKDSDAILISKALHTAKLDAVDSKIFLGNGFAKDLFQPFDFILELSSKKHYLVLINIRKIGLVCFIYLFDLFCIGVKLSSKQSYISNLIIGVNDIKNTKFNKYKGEEIINAVYGPPELRFQYYFPDQMQLEEFYRIEKDPQFSFYRDNGSLPLFRPDGSIAYKDVTEKINQLSTSATDLGDVNKVLIQQITMDEELYIKLLPTGSLVQIIRLQEERKFISKL